MLIRDLRRDFEKGLIVTASVIPVPDTQDWVIRVEYPDKQYEHLETRRGEGPRIFAKIDTAARLLKDIGFSDPQLRFEKPN